MTDATLPTALGPATIGSHDHWERVAARLIPANKARVLAALAAAGITHVVVGFDGEGDSGQIEGVQAFVGAAAASLPEVTIELLGLPYGAETPEAVGHDMASALETLAYDLLAETHGGWENSDGAYGEFVFDAVGGTITLEHNERIMSSERYDHSW